jgi:hypothetical protein
MRKKISEKKNQKLSIFFCFCFTLFTSVSHVLFRDGMGQAVKFPPQSGLWQDIKISFLNQAMPNISVGSMTTLFFVHYLLSFREFHYCKSIFIVCKQANIEYPKER